MKRQSRLLLVSAIILMLIVPIIYAQAVIKRIERAVSIPEKERKPAPEFAGTTLEGSAMRLADLRGKVVVLNFWYVACGPCRAEIPGLNRLVQEFDKGDVVFIALALDKADKLRLFLKEIPFRYQLMSEAGATAELYGVQAYPGHILIDRKGRIAHVIRGGIDKIEDILRPLITGLSQESK